MKQYYPDTLTAEEIAAELAIVEAEVYRRLWAKDPVAWAEGKLKDKLWSGQKKILYSVRDHRRTCAPTCHEVGKALAINTPLPTPTGWTTMQEVQPGDFLLDEEGKSTLVVAVSPIEMRACSRVVFRDGSSIIASNDHLWSVLNIENRRRITHWPYKVVDWRDYWDVTETLTTKEMAASATHGGWARWRIPTTQPLATSEPWKLSVPPYTFGAWLGDGTTVRGEITMHVDDAEFMLAAVGGRYVRTDSINKPQIRCIQFVDKPYSQCPGNESGGKRIPQEVLRCSIVDRLELLRGLMDTDGTCGCRGDRTSRLVGIGLSNKELIDDVYELVMSLGWVATRGTRQMKRDGKDFGKLSYGINFTPNVNPFKLPRKALVWEHLAQNTGGRQQSARTQRTIAAFEPVDDQPVKCVTVDSPRSLYLAGRSMVPTHNSYSAGILAAWWIDSHKPGEAFVVTTAPTAPQVQVILWKEIGRAFTRGALKGRVNQVEWLIDVNGHEEIVALGRKPSDYSPTAFQGIHAPYVLVIVDEANGVRGPLWEAIDSLIANDNSKILAIGNPDDPTGEFFDHAKPGSGWHVVPLSAFESPNFTGEPMPQSVLRQLIGRTYVEEKRRKWAPRWHWVNAAGKKVESHEGVRCVPPPDAKAEDTNPLWQSKVLGLFPEKTIAGGLIPVSWVNAARLRALEPGLPNELGVDVGAGGDESSVCQRQGSHYRIRRTDRDPDTMSQCGKIVHDLEETGATTVKIDKIGIGWGIVNRGTELGKPFVGINVGEGATADDTASDYRFLNLKAELWWNVRGLFERGDIDIDADDEDLAAELCSIRWERVSSGKIKISDKRRDEHGKLIASPNRAESLMLAAAPAPAVKAEWLTW